MTESYSHQQSGEMVPMTGSEFEALNILTKQAIHDMDKAKEERDELRAEVERLQKLLMIATHIPEQTPILDTLMKSQYRRDIEKLEAEVQRLREGLQAICDQEGADAYRIARRALAALEGDS